MRAATKPFGPSRFAVSLTGVGVILVSGMGGCFGGMAGIDAEVLALLDRRSEQLGGGAIVPDRRYDDTQRRPDSATMRRPGTTNPSADELRYDQAAVDRDVAARLSDFTRQARGGDQADALMIDLPEALRITQRTAREYLSAEEDYIFSAISLLIERHRWSPRLFNDTSATLSGNARNGSFDSALRVVNELRVTQRLPFGGTAEARWVWNATQDLRNRVSEEYAQSSSLVLNGNIPLLRGAGFVAQESIIQAERDLVYAARTFERFRRSLLVQISRDFFSLLESEARIRSEGRRVESQGRSLERVAARVDAGDLRPFERDIAENGLRQAESSLASLEEQYTLALQRFLVRLGLDPTSPARIEPFELALPDAQISPRAVAQLALSYRLDLQNRRDQLDDSRRAVANARNNVLADLNLTGSVTLPTDPDDRIGNLSFDPDETSFSLGVTYGLPLDRTIERLQVRQSVIRLAQRRRDYEQFRDNIIVAATAALRSIELARLRLQLAERQVIIVERRQEEQRINQAGVTAQLELDTANDLLNAENARDSAITDLRNAVLDYLLATGQLRVQPDGTFQPLPGMGLDETDGSSAD